MKVDLLGYKKVDIDKTQDGGSIHGIKIFVSAKERGTVGKAGFSFWLNDNVFEESVGLDLDDFIGKPVECEVDLKGKLIFLSVD